MLLLSIATGTFQFTNAEEFTFILVRMSDGQLRNSGGVTSVKKTVKMVKSLESKWPIRQDLNPVSLA